MIGRVNPYAASLLIVFLSFIGLACDDSCEPKPLADFCGSKCPKNRADAIARICASVADGGFVGDGWKERSNSCGGTSIENTGSIGRSYAFDRDGKLVGGVSWSDTNDGPCDSYDTYYGTRCVESGGTEHSCPGS